MESSNVQTQAHLSHSSESSSSISKKYLDSEDDNQLSLCCLCGKTFPTISSLHYHIDSEHDDANDDADSASTAGPSSSASDHCLSPSKPVSKRAFPITSLEDYRSGEAYSCPLCKRRFPGQISLKVHIETIHNGQRSATCEICAKRFSTLSYLRLHISTVHEGLKAYVCSICSKSYTQKHSLKKHVATAHHQKTATHPNGSQSSQTTTATSSLSPAVPGRCPPRIVKFGRLAREEDETETEQVSEHQVLKSLATGSPKTGIIRVPTSFSNNAHDVAAGDTASPPASPASPPALPLPTQNNESPTWQSS